MNGMVRVCGVCSITAALALLAAHPGQACLALQSQPPMALVIHGGGGSLPGVATRAEMEAGYRAGLSEALEAGYGILRSGGTSVDAVEAAIRVLEDHPFFNAGKGSAFNREGVNELDAAIMDGRQRDAGAVAIVKRVRNPISLARQVMENSPHVLLAGDGADEFARERGIDLVPHHYFFTERRWADLQRRLLEEIPYGTPGGGEGRARNLPATMDEEFGTVGAVALDAFGNLAAGTSTGGRVNKRAGRVGDSPVIGAGTYADNRGAAVSSTGLGELVLRALSSRTVSDLVRVERLSLQESVSRAVAEVREMGGEISLIALDAAGNIAIEQGHPGMYRGYIAPDGERAVLIWDEQDARRRR